jgi:endonuclease-3 related protein
MLAEYIRPAGYFNIKAQRITNFLRWLSVNYSGDLAAVENVSTSSLRESLLAVKGIGPETADSILLYAFTRPVFVIDAYTARITARHRLIEPGASYESLQDLFMSNLAPDVAMFNEYHALLVCVGKDYCRKTARCSGCPLETLPHDAIVEF